MQHTAQSRTMKQYPIPIAAKKRRDHMRPPLVDEGDMAHDLRVQNAVDKITVVVSPVTEPFNGASVTANGVCG